MHRPHRAALAVLAVLATGCGSLDVEFDEILTLERGESSAAEDGRAPADPLADVSPPPSEAPSAAPSGSAGDGASEGGSESDGAADEPSEPSAPELGRGDSGEEVEAWQEQLDRWRESTGRGGIAVDGIYGPGTEAATQEFESAVGVEVDGIVQQRDRDAMAQALG